jgi:hypothetical protein
MVFKTENSLHQAIVTNVTGDMWLVNLDESGVVQNIIMHKPPYTRQINGETSITLGRWITIEAYLKM